MTDPFLPYGRQSLDDDDIAAVCTALKGDWLTTGPAVDAFENALADRLGAAQAVACSSGTAALHLAMLALGIGPGDRVVVPAITFLATANAVRYAGAEVSFADVDPMSGLMTPDNLSQALADGGPAEPVRAAIPVHLAGQCTDMAAIAELAKAHDLFIVEDACHAIGAAEKGIGGDGPAAIGACAHGDMAVFSFHPVKTVTMGEGGAVTTNNPALAAGLRRMRNHGMTRDLGALLNRADGVAGDGTANPWYYEMRTPGYNYRASDIHCALGLSQLKKLDRFVERRRRVAEHYDNLIVELAPLVRPLARSPGCRPAWHLYVVLIDFDALGVERAQVMNRLQADGIGTQVHYYPVHQQPYYRARYGDIALPGAQGYYRRCLSLPLFAEMTDGDAERVARALRRALGL